MHIENAEKFFTDLNFVKGNIEDDCIEYFLRVSDNIQLFTVVRNNNWLYFISEHEIINVEDTVRKIYENDYDNIKILSEYVTTNELFQVLVDYKLMTEIQAQLHKIILKMKQLHKKDKNDEFEFREFYEYAEIILEDNFAVHIIDNVSYCMITEMEAQQFIRHAKAYIEEYLMENAD